jgi:hypothetical protein
MAKRIWNVGQEVVSEYSKRCDEREVTLMNATMNFVGYFMGLGDSKIDAETKVAELSTEVAAFLYSYRLGNTQPLINSINNSSLVFMDAAAKIKITGDLTI